MRISASSIKLLQSIQQTLQVLYEVEVNLDISDFVLCDRSHIHACSNAEVPTYSPEQLLIR